MKDLDVLVHSEHMNEDGLIEQAEQFHNDLALLQHQQKTAVATNAVSLKFCEECGNDIPEQRRLAVAGVTLCVSCKQAQELRNRIQL